MKLKKLLSIILAAAILLTTVQISFAFLLSAESDVVYYVAANGSDTTGNGSEAAPFATINKAQEVVHDAETSNPVNATIMVKGEADFDGGVEHDGMITIEGVDGASALALVSNQTVGAATRLTVIKGDTTLKNIGFITNESSSRIVTDGHKFVFDVKSSAVQPTIYVGSMDEDSTNKVEDVTVNNWPGTSTSGLELAIRGGVNTAAKRVSAGVNLTVNGGYFKLIEFARTKYSGDVNLVYNKFSPTTDFKVELGNNVSFGGALQIIANNGITTDVVGELSTASATKGKWIIYGANGGQVTPTAVAGKFNVTFDTGYISAKAVNKDTNAEVPVENGEVTLDAGTYDVIFQKQAQGGTVTEKTYYVDTENGLDTNNGNQGAPFKTLDKAMETAVNTEYTTGGAVNATIFVKGNNINFDGGIAHLGTFIIKGYGEDVPIVSLGTETVTDSSGAQVTGTLLKGHTTFDGVAFAKNSDTIEKHIISGGYKLVLKNIANYELSNYSYHIGYGDSTTTDTKDVGEFANIGTNGNTNIILGAVSNTNKTSAGLDLNLNGGKISGITFLNGTEYTGNVNINLSSFTATDKATFVNNGATFGGAFQFIVNKASKVNLAESALSNIQAVTATGGKWAIYSDNTGGSISATETPGTFKVGGAYYAIATDVTNPETVYNSDDDKKLKLPQGSYDVTYVPELPLAGPTLPTPETVEKEYYLDTANGSDDNDGLTASTPFKTLAKAQATAATFEKTDNIVNVTVNLKGELIIETQAHKGMLTINGLDDTAITGFPSNHVLNGPLTLNNITSKLNGNHPTTDGHEFIMNSKKDADTNNVYYNVGNSTGGDSSYSNEKVTIIDNKRSASKPASYYIGALGTRTVIGSVDFLHQSGHIKWIDFKTSTTYKGNVNITIDSFTQRTDDETQYYAEMKSGNPTFEKAFQVIYNNSSANSIKTAKVFETNAITAAGGKWIIYAESGALLRTTKLAGVFEVIGVDTVATAVNRDDSSKIYTSNEQNLIHIEEPGVYTVTFDGPDLEIPDEPAPTNIIEKTFYANATTGNDDNDGLTPQTAVRTINKAQALAADFENIATDTAVNATIYLSGGEFEFDGGVAHRGMFTLVGDGTADTTLVVKRESHGGIVGSTLKGPTTLKDINITDSANNEHILTNGHKLVLDINQPDSQKKNIFVGNTDDTGSLKNEYVTVNNITGAYSLASSYQFGSFGALEGTGNVNLVHNNGCLYSFQFAKDGLFKGTVNITVNGYTTRKDSAGAPRILVRDNVTFMQAVQLIFNNETDAQFVENQLTKATAKRGIWIMYGDNGGTLEVTDTYGTFKATSDKTCYAVNKETYKIYKAENGVLTVPAGEYDVYYRDTEPDIEMPYPDANEELNDTEGTIKEYYVYVAPESEGGSNRNGDGSQEKPFRTIDKAMYHIASIPKETGVIKKGIIMLSGEAEFDGGEPHANMITIKAWNNTAKVVTVNSGYFVDDGSSVVLLSGPVTFDGVMIPKTTVSIVTNGHELIITGCSEDGKTESGRDVRIYATQLDSPANNTKGEKVTVNGWSGSAWGGLNLDFGPDGTVAGKSIGKIDAVINSGKFKSLRLRPGIYNDDVNFTWNSGSYTSGGPYYTMLVKYAQGTHTFKGAFQFIVNNGYGETPPTQYISSKVNPDGTPTYPPNSEDVLFTSIQAEKGEWFMYADIGGRLSTTDTAGTFAVAPGAIATAVNRSTGKSYDSVNGELTVPEGIYDITFQKDVENAIYVDAMTLETETVGQTVRLENGKTYKFSFDYRNIENGIGNNVNIAVYSGKNILYSTALTGDKNIKLVSEATGTYHRVYEFTFRGTTGDYGVGFAINGSTIMRIYSPELIESNNTIVNLYKNASVKKNLENWVVSSKTAAADATELSYTQGDAYAAIEIGEYYLSDYRKVSSDAKALYIKSDGEFSIGTNIELQGGKTYRLVIEHKDVNTDFYHASTVIVRNAYGTDSSVENLKSTYHNVNTTLPRVSRDTQYSRVVYEFTTYYDSVYGIGIRAHEISLFQHLYNDYEMYIGNIALYDIGDPRVNLINNSNFSDNLNGWYVAEHTEVSKDTGHKITTTKDIKLDATATSYGNPETDKDYIKLVDMNGDSDFFKILKGDEVGPKKMLYVQNGSTFTTLHMHFKEEETLKPNHTYVCSFAICSDYDYNLIVAHAGERYRVFGAGLAPISKEEIAGDGYKYKIVTYEFTLPEEVNGIELSKEIFVGIELKAAHSAWVFDYNLYDKADPRKTNLVANPEFRHGLDNWVWGWKGFESRWLGWGWTSWPSADNDEEDSMLYVADYDFKNLISYKDDSNINDGEWWNPDDVVNFEAQPETGYVSGTLVDDKGNPLKDITVELESVSDSSVVYKVTTDAKGFFEIKEVLADMYKVFITSSDGTRRDTETYISVTDTAIITMNIKVAPKEITVNTQTKTARSTVKGTLYNAKREPLAGVTVGVARNRTMVTDENGNFEFTDLPAGKYKIFAVNPDGSYYLLRTYDLGEGQVVSLKLKYDPDADSGKDTDDVDNDTNGKSNNLDFLWWILIAVGVVLIIGAGTVIVIVLLKKKKKE